MRCDQCRNWLLKRQTCYEDGTIIVNYTAPEGKGHCEILNLDTLPDFGCAKFIDGGPIILSDGKAGAPWQHFVMGPCPDCDAAGSKYGRACRRCGGVGKLRHYDDGYVADEHREHPKEKERRKQLGIKDPPRVDPGTLLTPLPRKEDNVGEVFSELNRIGGMDV